jgi:hypothetical protein
LLFHLFDLFLDLLKPFFGLLVNHVAFPYSELDR